MYLDKMLNFLDVGTCHTHVDEEALNGWHDKNMSPFFPFQKYVIDNFEFKNDVITTGLLNTKCTFQISFA